MVTTVVSGAWRGRLSHVWLAIRLGVWLLGLPVRLRRYPLPVLLERLAAVGEQQAGGSPQDLERVVRLVVRVCRLRCFRLRLFPRACLRQALALYYILTRMGYAVTIHFGVHKVGEELRGHSWVTIQGTPVAESTPAGVFHCVYAYPSGV
ncbi:MAG TPA: lasso peptide biosynthesis B2 protein [Candidatus Tectomicrobia bacterium]|jgi:hypothetical protein